MELVENLKKIKAVLSALVIVLVCVVVYNLYANISERLSCVFSDCKTELIEKNAKQEAEIAKLKGDLQTAKDTLDLLQGNKKDNQVAVANVKEKDKEVDKTTNAIIQKAREQSKPKPIVTAVAGSDPPVVDAAAEEFTTYTAEAIIDSLWEMHCEGKTNECSNLS